MFNSCRVNMNVHQIVTYICPDCDTLYGGHVKDQPCCNTVIQTDFPSIEPFVIKFTLYNAEMSSPTDEPKEGSSTRIWPKHLDKKIIGCDFHQNAPYGQMVCLHLAITTICVEQPTLGLVLQCCCNNLTSTHLGRLSTRPREH